jgi:glyoxylase-like metal-dependent hydrolase (beta-lactamase superfamily II)
MNRRDFIRAGSSCVAHLGLWARIAPVGPHALFAARPVGPIVASEPWGRIEQLGDGVWALVSTPLAGGAEAMRTFSNGGIVAGRSGVLVVEGLASEDGARWLAETARQLTGRPPTHVVLTHYHGDHSAGLAGYRTLQSSPVYLTTAVTRERLQSSRPAVAATLSQAEIVPTTEPHVIDLGGRHVSITPRAGHTLSDLSVAVDEPAVVFGGDLLWNRFFPNYVDAIPSVLAREVKALAAIGSARFVPGHGSIYTAGQFSQYVELLDLVEDAARRARTSGMPAAAAARELVLPDALKEWVLFGESYYEVALRAWEREFAGR